LGVQGREFGTQKTSIQNKGKRGNQRPGDHQRGERSKISQERKEPCPIDLGKGQKAAVTGFLGAKISGQGEKKETPWVCQKRTDDSHKP